jgi:uncharacterized protein YndB with AHSA1/START domain
MSASLCSVTATAPLELVVSRLIDASPALVFKAWTQQEHAARWWGPAGFTIVSCRLDAMPGGTYRVAMRSPDGIVRTKRGTYREVVAPERLVFTYAWEDTDGNPGHEMLITVTFEPQGDQTVLTLRQTGFADAGERDSHRGGWTSCFERFAEHMLATKATLA